MKPMFPTARALATGAALGAVLLGLAGRLATAGLAVALGSPANLSAGGVLETMIVGSIWGAFGALVLSVEDRVPASRVPRGILAGAVTFAGSMLFGWALGHGPDLGRAEGRVTTAVAAAAFVLFGAALGRALPRRRTR